MHDLKMMDDYLPIEEGCEALVLPPPPPLKPPSDVRRIVGEIVRVGSLYTKIDPRQRIEVRSVAWRIIYHSALECGWNVYPEPYLIRRLPPKGERESEKEQEKEET